MTTEQRRALANTIPTTDVIRDAVTFPRDRLGEPLDISAERFDAWLVQVKRDAAREALDGLAAWHDREAANSGPGSHYWDASNHVATSARHHRDTYYPKETP